MTCSVSILANSVAIVRAGPAAAASGVEVAARDVANLWWVANATDRLNGPDAARTLFYMRVLMNLFQADPNSDPGPAADQVRQLMVAVAAQPDNALVSGRAPGWLLVVTKALTAGLASGKLAPAVAHAAQVTISQVANVAPVSKAGIDQVERVADLDPAGPAVSSDTAETLTKVIVMARQPGLKRFQAAFDLDFAAATAATGTSAADLIAGNPHLQNTQAHSLVGHDGSIKTDLAQIRTLVNTQLAAVDAQKKAAAAELAKTLTAEDLAANREEQKRVLDVARADLLLLSTFIGTVDASLGTKTLAFGNAAIAVADAFSQFASVLNRTDTLAKASNVFSTVALTGNVILAVITIFQLFAGDTVPDSDVLSEIKALREQVKQLADNVKNRFDRVDSALNRIYSDMMDQFNRIDTATGAIRGQVGEIQRTLSELNLKLNEIQKNLYPVIGDGFRRPLWNQVDYSLGYRGRTTQSLPYNDYIHADSDFYTWATLHAYDQTATGADGRPTDDGALAAELGNYPLDTNVKYLAQLPTKWGLPALVSHRVPNPRDWYIAARAYLAMNLDYPSDAHQNYALGDEVNALVAAGQQYQDLEHAILGDVDANGFNPLFRTLLARYRDKMTAVGNAIAQETKDFGDNKVGDGSLNVFNLKPFGGANQSIPQNRKATFNGTTEHTEANGVNHTDNIVTFCGTNITAGDGAIGPKAVDAAMPAVIQIEQMYLGKGTTDVCADPRWGPERRTDDGAGTVYVTRPLVVYLTSTWTPTPQPGSPRIPVQAVYASASTEPFIICQYSGTRETRPPGCPPGDAKAKATEKTKPGDTVVKDNWAFVVKPALERARATSFGPAMDPLIQDVKATLSELQKGLYGQIATDLSSSGRLAGAAKELDGAKAAIQAYVQVGMPATLASDDVLRGTLFGSGPIFDLAGLKDNYRAAAINPPDADNWLSISQTSGERVGVLTTAIQQDLAIISRGYIDGSVAVRSTVDRLKLLPGMLNTPALNVLPTTASHYFGPVRPGTTRDLPLTVSNAGLGITALGSITAQGAPFRIVANTCGARLEALSECTVTVRFAPPAAGPVTGSVVAQSNVGANPTMAALSGGTIDLASSASPGIAGQSVTFTATVASPSGGGGPSGTVQFKDGSTNLAAPVAVSGGVAVLSSSSLTAGTHSITAVYSGDSNYSSSTTQTLAQTVIRTNTTATLASSANPGVAGQNVTFTAAVAATSGGGQPTGTVQFKDGVASLGAPVAVSGGVATLSTSSLTAGTHAITAAYSGDALFNASTAATLNEEVNRTNTNTALTTSSFTANAGQGVTFTATVAPASGAGRPTGTVQFNDGGTNIGAPVTVNGAVASLTTATLAAGFHPITAIYSGDALFNSSTSRMAGVFIFNGPPPPTRTNSTASLSSSAGFAVAGQSVTFTATVASSGAGTPTGTVQFKDGTTSMAAPVAVSGGVATFSTSALTAGSHSVTATYSGDTMFDPSTSSQVMVFIN